MVSLKRAHLECLRPFRMQKKSQKCRRFSHRVGVQCNFECESRY